MSFQFKIPFVSRFSVSHIYIDVICTTIPNYKIRVWNLYDLVFLKRWRNRNTIRFFLRILGWLQCTYTIHPPKTFSSYFTEPGWSQIHSIIGIFCKTHLWLSAFNNFNVLEFPRNRILRLYDLTDFVRWQLWHVLFFRVGYRAGGGYAMALTEWLSLY